MIDKDVYYIPCTEVLVGVLKHKAITESHFYRKHRGDVNYCGFDSNKWYFT